MSSRDTILLKARMNQPAAAPHPGTGGDWQRFEDPVRQFQETLEAVGGRLAICESRADAAAALEDHPQREQFGKIVSHCPEVMAGNFDGAAVARPHELADVDLAVLPGEFGVAENAAVWVTDGGLPHRSLYFITQHLCLTLKYTTHPADALVHNLAEAYERIGLEGTGFGLFISGPSKTADIEQSLVIGAHGPRSLTVVMLPRQEPGNR